MKKPWFKKKRISIPLAALLLLVVVSVSQQSAQNAANDKVAAGASQQGAIEAVADKGVGGRGAGEAWPGGGMQVVPTGRRCG